MCLDPCCTRDRPGWSSELLDLTGPNPGCCSSLLGSESGMEGFSPSFSFKYVHRINTFL